MQQYLHTGLLGVVGHIGAMRGKGTQLVVYINKVDQYGQIESRQKVHVALFNDAERAVLKNNTRNGDYVLISDAVVSTPPPRKEGDMSEGYVQHLKCTWANQIKIIAGDNHKTLMSRQNHLSA